MGNSSTKEQRPPPGRSSSAQAESARQPHSRSVSESSGLPSQPGTASLSTSGISPSRPGRGSRPDLSFLGLSHGSERDVASLETRRDARQERETRRLERERAARQKERERSMREEGVDGGYLVTQGVYTGTEDYSKSIVRRLMIERRLAPFFKGLNEHSAAWRDDELVAAVKGLPLTAEARPPSPRQARASAHRASAAAAATTTAAASRIRDRDRVHDRDQDPNGLTAESCSRSRSYTSESSKSLLPSHPAFSNAHPTTSSPALIVPSSPPFRPRSKTLASLTSLAKNHSQDDMTPQEIHLPKPVHVDGRPVEAFLYRNASECPICFLFYPPYLNRTRCCDQPICSECFVQIKRPDPHPPEHAEPGSRVQAQDDDVRAGARESLVMEPAACPFCVQSELGVTYEPPPFRSGLVYPGQTSAASSPVQVTSAMSSSSSLSSFSGQPIQTRRRTNSLPPTSSTVVTTDRIRPDWSQKLADANAHLARRSAAATALHSAAYSRGGLSFGAEGRSVLNFGRRTRPGRGTRTDDSGTGSSLASNVRPGDAADTMSLELADSDGDDGAQARAIRVLFGDHGGGGGGGGGGSARRSRLQDLEDMMMEQAIRLSLVAEEERRQKEEIEARTQLEEELRKEGGRGNGVRPAPATGDAPPRRTAHGPAAVQASSGCQDRERSRRDGASANGKGKAVDRGTIPPRSSPLARGPSSAGDVPSPPRSTSGPLETDEHRSWIGSSTMDSSQTRHASSRSSPGPFLAESTSSSTHGPSETPATGRPSGSDNDGQRRTGTPSAAGTTNGDPVFAFSSLAAMIDDTTGRDEKPDEHSGSERREASPSPARELQGH